MQHGAPVQASLVLKTFGISECLYNSFCYANKLESNEDKQNIFTVTGG